MNNKSKTKQNFTKGAAVMLFSTLIVKLIGAFFKIPLSSDYCLGDVGFGYFSSVYDIYIPIYTIASSGFPVAISKILSDMKAKGEVVQAESSFKMFKTAMLILGIFGLIMILFSSVALNDNNTKFGMIAMAPAVLFCLLSSAYRGFFESKQNMTPPAVSNVIEALSKVFLGFTAAFVTVRLTNNYALGAASAILGITLGTLISFIYLKISNRKYQKTKTNEKFCFDKRKLLKELVSISLPIVFAALAGSIISLIDAVTVGQILSELTDNYYSQLSSEFTFSHYLTQEILPTYLYGLRSKAYTLFNLVPTFISSLAVSGIPAIASAFSSGNRDTAYENSNRLIKFSSVIAFPLSFGMIFIGSKVMLLLYGNNSAYEGGIILSIYGIAALFAGISMALTAVLQSIGKQNKAFWNFALGIALKIVLNFTLVGNINLNIYGSAISTAICYFAVTVLHITVLAISKFRFDIKNSLIKPLLAAFTCGLSAFIICSVSDSNLITLLAVFVAAIVYIVLLFLQKTFTYSDFSGVKFFEKFKKIT